MHMMYSLNFIFFYVFSGDKKAREHVSNQKAHI